MVLNIILECLLKWFAPIFVFTTDEIHGLIKTLTPVFMKNNFKPTFPMEK